MFYDTLSANTVKITLSGKDMSDYAISSDDLLERGAASKRSLTRFLKRFQSESSLFPGRNADRLFLEAFPSADGGCIVYVSTLGTSPLPECEESLPDATLMCVTDGIAELARLCRCISGRIRGSGLYRIAGGWCLIVTAEQREAEALSRIMEEYGELSDDITDIASAAEHGRLIRGSHAAEALSELA